MHLFIYLHDNELTDQKTVDDILSSSS